jgi:hypothetical protein
MDTWLRLEGGQRDRAAVVAADMINEGERHGFDMWRLVGAIWQAVVGVLAALDADDVDPTGLGAHIEAMMRFLGALRKSGVNIYTTVFDGILGRLLIAAADPRQPANAWTSGWRWPETPGCASTTPNCCGYAPRPTTSRPHAKPTSMPPSNSPAARARPYSNCALHLTISNFAASQRSPPSPMPQTVSMPTTRGRNWRGPEPHTLSSRNESDTVAVVCFGGFSPRS